MGEQVCPGGGARPRSMTGRCRIGSDPPRVREIWFAIGGMGLRGSIRISLSIATGLAGLTCALLAGSAGSAPLSPVYHPYAVKGQTIELEIPAPSYATKMSFNMQKLDETLTDLEAPFRFSIPTAGFRPANYRWGSRAYGPGCCESQGTGGAIQIYPLPRIRGPKVSALVVAGTTRLAGLVVSRVARNRTVRAWSFPKTGNGLRKLPLQLRQKRKTKHIYRVAGGATVNVGRRTEIAVEVAPTKKVFRHGVEVRGRLARILLTRNPSSGVTRAHRNPVVPCTTASVRKESFPGSQSCTLAPASSTVSILCEKLEPCRPGAPTAAGRRQD